MTQIHKRFFLLAAAFAAIVLSAQLANAGTILKLSLGNVGPDVEYSGGAAGVFSTVDDLDANTTGEQNTAIDFVGDLSFLADILTSDASYTLNGVTASGLAVNAGGVLGQLFDGGEFQLYDAANVLLLDVELDQSAFSGFVGSSTGAEFSINEGMVVGGTLDQYLINDTVTFSIALTDINGGAGPTITPVGPPPFPGIQPGTLDAFTADADKLVAAEFIPEPSTALMLMLGGLSAVGLRRRAA